MGIQTITTPTGDDMVVMSKAEYEALVSAAENAFEDGADTAAYAFAVANASPQDILPADVSASILRGTGRIRAFREWRGFDKSALAGACGFTLEELDDFESGSRVLSRDAAGRLSLALDLPSGWLAD